MDQASSGGVVSTEIVLAVMMTLHGWRGFSPENARMYAEEISFAARHGAQTARDRDQTMVVRLGPLHAAWLLVSGCRPGATSCFGIGRADQDAINRCFGACNDMQGTRRGHMWILRMAEESVYLFDMGLQTCGTLQGNQIGDIPGYVLTRGRCLTSPTREAMAAEVHRVRELLMERMRMERPVRT